MVVPADIPVTTPVADTVPITGVLLLHVPDGVAQASGVVCPTHACNIPVIDAGVGSTVTTAVTLQPVPTVYVTIHVPEATPVIAPVVVFTVAMVGHTQDQVPPGVAVVSDPVFPAQTCSDPVIAAGNEYTVTTCVTRQVVGNV